MVLTQTGLQLCTAIEAVSRAQGLDLKHQAPFLNALETLTAELKTTLHAIRLEITAN